MNGPAPHAPRRVFGYWTCLALVVGNMIGSGVYLLPATLAPFQWNGVAGWIVTIAGATCVAAVLGVLSRTLPLTGGPYAFSRAAFGPFTGFQVAWIYWASLWIGNAAIATGVVAPLATLVPAIAQHSVIATCLIAWALIALNCFDARAVGGVQVLTVALKFVPLLAIAALAVAILWSGGARQLPPFDEQQLHLGGATGIGAAAAVTLWALTGLESATIPAERVKDAGRTIFRATLSGTVITGLLYLFVCSAVALLQPVELVSRSGAPMADFVRPYWGPAAAVVMALAAALSAFGSLNGMLLVQGEMPWAMARDGVFPRALAPLSKRGTPVRAQLVSGVLLTIVLLINGSRSLTELFKFLILLATLATVLPYLVCALAALKLKTRGTLAAGAWLLPTAVLATLYSGWATWGAGTQAMLWGLLLILAGVPVYFLSRSAKAD